MESTSIMGYASEKRISPLGGSRRCHAPPIWDAASGSAIRPKKALQLYSPLRYYYICRNQTYLELQHSEGWYRVTCSLRRIKYLVLTIGIILFFDNLKAKNLCVCGWNLSWFLGKLGKTWS